MYRPDSNLPEFLKRIKKRDKYYPIIAIGIMALFLSYDAFSLKDGMFVLDELDSAVILIMLVILGFISMVYKKINDAKMKALLKKRQLYGGYDDLRDEARPDRQA